MKVELPKGIASISGKFGNMIFKTYKRPNGGTETRAYLRPEKTVRQKPLSDAETNARFLFVRRQAYVQELMASGTFHSKAEAWKVAKKEIQ